MRITLASGEPFAFAGLWETWQDPNGEPVISCTIITTEANELVAAHPRPDARHPPQRPGGALAGQRGAGCRTALVSLLAPYPADAMETYEVSTLVNSTFNDGPELLTPTQQPRLI